MFNVPQDGVATTNEINLSIRCMKRYSEKPLRASSVVATYLYKPILILLCFHRFLAQLNGFPDKFNLKYDTTNVLTNNCIFLYFCHLILRQ